MSRAVATPPSSPPMCEGPLPHITRRRCRPDRVPVRGRSDERQLEAAVFPDRTDVRPAKGVGLTALARQHHSRREREIAAPHRGSGNLDHRQARLQPRAGRRHR